MRPRAVAWVPGAGARETREPAWVSSGDMRGDFSEGDDEPQRSRPLPPEDRLWRHPSELASTVHVARPTKARRGVWLASLVSGVAGAVATIAILAATGLLAGNSVSQTPSATQAALSGSAEGAEPTDPGTVAAVQRVLPSMTVAEVDVGGETHSTAAVAYRVDGYLITSARSLEGADGVVVFTGSGEHPAEIVGSDRQTDVAVLRIDVGDLRPPEIRESLDLEEGETAIVVGPGPERHFGPSVFTGVVSGLGRRVDDSFSGLMHDMIQTDAPVESVSGGVLVDGEGLLVGYVTGVSDAASELSYATPVPVAHDVAEDIVRWGRARHAWLGIEGTDLDTLRARELDVEGGAEIQTVLAGSPAEEAGLQASDVITGVDDEPIANMSELVVALRTMAPGDSVDVDYLRDGEAATCTATLEERPPE